ncbi:non-specific serine/threonine protein kinase [Ranunculus cassubicifolius]
MDRLSFVPFFPFLCLCIAGCLLFEFSFEQLIFMNSRSTVASSVSCQAGSKNDFSSILVCLLPKFLGLSFAHVNFHLFKAIIRNPSSSVCNFLAVGGCHP